MYSKLKTLRMEFSICGLGFVDTPEIYANEIDEIFSNTLDFLFPTNGHPNSFGDYYARRKRDWMFRFLTALKKRIDWRLDILSGKIKNLPDKL